MVSTLSTANNHRIAETFAEGWPPTVICSTFHSPTMGESFFGSSLRAGAPRASDIPSSTAAFIDDLASVPGSNSLEHVKHNSAPLRGLKRPGRGVTSLPVEAECECVGFEFANAEQSLLRCPGWLQSDGGRLGLQVDRERPLRRRNAGPPRD